MGDADASPPAQFGLLPHDMLVCVLSALVSTSSDAVAAICNIACCSLRLHQAACEDAIWHSLLVNRGCGHLGLGNGTTARHTFRAHWQRAQRMLLEALSELGARAAPASCGNLPALTVCSSSDRRPTSVGASIDSIASGIRHIAAALAAGDVCADDCVRILFSRGLHKPLHSFAILAVLMQQDKLEYAALPIDDAADAMGRHDTVCVALAAAVRQLGTRSTPAAALDCKLLLQWWTWSQARDCRGFRARDDVHSLSATLDDLYQRPDHKFWQVLQRGVVQEVRSMRISAVDEADDNAPTT